MTEAPPLSDHLKPKLLAAIHAIGPVTPSEAIEIAEHHLANVVAALAISSGMRRGEARARARKAGDVAVELVTAVLDQAKAST